MCVVDRCNSILQVVKGPYEYPCFGVEQVQGGKRGKVRGTVPIDIELIWLVNEVNQAQSMPNSGCLLSAGCSRRGVKKSSAEVKP